MLLQRFFDKNSMILELLFSIGLNLLFFLFKLSIPIFFVLYCVRNWNRVVITWLIQSCSDRIIPFKTNLIRWHQATHRALRVFVDLIIFKINGLIIFILIKYHWVLATCTFTKFIVHSLCQRTLNYLLDWLHLLSITTYIVLAQR